MPSASLRELVENLSVPMIIERLHEMAEEGWRNIVPLCSEGASVMACGIRASASDLSASSVPCVGDQAPDSGLPSR